jgi:Putative metallopeptidase
MMNQLLTTLAAFSISTAINVLPTLITAAPATAGAVISRGLELEKGVRAGSVRSVGRPKTAEVMLSGTSIHMKDPNLNRQHSEFVKLLSQNTPKRNIQSKGNGKIRVIYRNSKDPIGQMISQVFRKERFFELASSVITAKVRLPRDIQIVMQDCGSENAYYTQSDRSITICNELTTSIIKTFIATGMKPEDAGETAVYAVTFIFYHEAGHMIIHELGLPITGREEDVADQFSNYILLDWFNVDEATGQFGQKVVASAAQFFSANKTGEFKLSTFLDEHSLNEQRFVALVCMLYIKNPDQYAGLVSKLGFAPSRLRLCRNESAQITQAWNTLLKPHFRQGGVKSGQVDRGY